MTRVVDSSTVTAEEQEPRLPAEPGVWVFIGGDLVVFAFLFVVYLIYRVGDPESFEDSQRALNVYIGVTNTLVLLTSSLLVALAVHAVRAGDRVRAPRLVLGSMLCGVAFGLLKVLEYHHELAAHHTPGENHFFLFYYLLTGLHLVHVILGLGVLTFLWVLARRADELTQMGSSYVEGCACFWHLVDLLWIVIFPLLYLVR